MKRLNCLEKGLIFFFSFSPDLESVFNTDLVNHLHGGGGWGGAWWRGGGGGGRVSALLESAAHWQKLPIIVDFSSNSRLKSCFPTCFYLFLNVFRLNEELSALREVCGRPLKRERDIWKKKKVK